MRRVRLALVCGLFLALPLMAAAQAEPDPATPLAATADVSDPTAADAAMLNATMPDATMPDATMPDATATSTTRTIEAGAVVAPFAGVSVADTAPVLDEAVPQATPSPREKLPPGPPTRWP